MRVACAWAIEVNASRKVAITRSLIVNRNLFIWSLLFFLVESWGWPPVEHGSVPATVAPSLPIVDINTQSSKRLDKATILESGVRVVRTPTPVNPSTTWQIRTADGIPNVIGGTYPRVSG